MKHTFKLLSIIGTPLIAMLASCATSTSATSPTPRAHRHGNLVHSHAITQATGIDHQHASKESTTEKTMIKVAKKKIVVPVKPAKPADIKPLGLKGIGHKHHTHIEPKTGEEGVPC